MTWRAIAIAMLLVAIVFSIIDAGEDIQNGPLPVDWGATHSMFLFAIAAGVLSLQEKRE